MKESIEIKCEPDDSISIIVDRYYPELEFSDNEFTNLTKENAHILLNELIKILGEINVK